MEYQILRKEIAYDGLTPTLVYQALGGLGAILFESAFEKGEGKVSFIGVNPLGTFQSHGLQIQEEFKGVITSFRGDPYEALKKFSKGRKTFGFIGYQAIRLKESLPDRHPKTGFPDFFFHFYETVIAFYHDQQKVICFHEGNKASLNVIMQQLQTIGSLETFQSPQKIDFQVDLTEQEFIDLVDKAKEFIRAGDIFQVVLSRTFYAKIKAKPFEIYRALRQVSPSPYHFFFEEKEFAIAGASPELMIAVQGGVIESMPIAGTMPKEISKEYLLNSSKDNAEHVMLVDLARNDVGAVSFPGSVTVADYKTIKAFSHVNHLISRVTGKLDSKFHSLDAFKASFPAGTLSGAPKIRAMEIIDTLEKSRRDLYGGAVVFLDEEANLMSCIAIRTAFIQESKVQIRVGAGIVLDSNGLSEAQETEHKAKSVFEALELAEGGLQ